MSTVLLTALMLALAPGAALATKAVKNKGAKVAPAALAEPPPAPTPLPEKDPEGATFVIERFDNVAGKSLEDLGWKGGTFENGKTNHALVTENGKSFIRSHYLPGTDAQHLYKELDWDLAEFPYLRWRWRARKLPTAAKITDPKRSDAVAQVYILWEVGRKKNVIKYFWGVQDKVGETLNQSNIIMGKLYGEVIRAGGPVNTWFTEVRNVLDDYKRAFGDVPSSHARGIAILSDADETKSESEADYADFVLLKEAPVGKLHPAPPVKLTQ